MADGNKSTLEDLTLHLKRHETVLETLKDVPSILSNLVKKMGNDPDKKAENPDEKAQGKGKWSLGLSDEEIEYDPDSEADNILQTNDDNEELAELLKDSEKTAEFGPSLLQNVSTGFSKTAVRPLTKESRLALKEKIRIPENCKEFVTPKVNAEIWRMLPSHAKIVDMKQQQTQQVLGLGLSSLASIANSLVCNKDKIPKEVVSSVVKQALDCANAMGDQFQSLSSRRRFEMKKFLNPEYAGICATQFPNSEWLFGQDLAENLKSTKATSSLMRNTMNRGNRYHPYSQPRHGYQNQNQRGSLNWNRPSYPQSRGSGQFQPRFGRPQGQRMLNPYPNKYQRN